MQGGEVCAGEANAVEWVEGRGVQIRMLGAQHGVQGDAWFWLAMKDMLAQGRTGVRLRSKYYLLMYCVGG